MPTKATVFVLSNALAFTAVLMVNYLATALPIAGRTPGGVSDMFPTLFARRVSLSPFGG